MNTFYKNYIFLFLKIKIYLILKWVYVYILRKIKRTYTTDTPLNKKKKKCYELKHNKKISNLIDELHWKTINYLTHNYKTILIGNMSSKNIVS